MSMANVTTGVTAPTRTPYRYGLFSVLDFIGNERVGTFLSWDSIGCGPVDALEADCLTGNGDTLAATGTIDCANTGSVASFTVQSVDDSSLGRPRRTAGDTSRAETQLLLQEQAAVETIVSEFLYTTGTDASTVASGADLETRVRVSLGEVEAQLALLGGEGIVLVRRSIVALIPDAFKQTGSTLRTLNGTPVASCGGWGATAPDFAVLGVSAFVANRGPLVAFEGAPNTSINDRSAIAQRDYQVGWECEAVFAETTAA